MVLKPGDKYIVVVKEQAFFKSDKDGKYYPVEESSRIEIREKKATTTTTKKEDL